MHIDIFNVEHGSCALVTTDNNKHILIDCGHNSTTGWRPSAHLARLKVYRIEKLIITNCDRDHASDLPNIIKQFQITQLTKNPSITEKNLREIKGVGNMSPAIDALATMIGNYNAESPDEDFGGITFSYYWNNYPKPFEDENNLSLVTVLQYSQFRMCFPGDIEKPGWENLARGTDLLRDMAGVDILLASHHGRENGCCDLLYEKGWRPGLTIISDSGIEHATQETVQWYRSRTQGIPWNGGETRRVLTTRSDGAIRIVPKTDGGFWVTSEMEY